MYSENLKKIRLELKISAQKFADSLNVSRGSIVQYETGKRKPSYEFIEALHNLYNVNLNWFVSGQGEMFNKQQKASAGMTPEEVKSIVASYLKDNGIIV